MYTNNDVLIGVTLASLALILIGYYVRKHRRWSAIIDRIPGPKGIPLFGNSLMFFTKQENIFRIATELATPLLAQQYPLMRLWAGPLPMVIVIRAEAAKVLLNNNKEIEKAVMYRFLHNWIGDGLLTSTGTKWQRRRKLITPSFHFRILENFLLVMNEQAEILVQILDRKCQQIKYSEFDIYPYITRCTLDIICETAMGQGVNAQINTDSEYVTALKNLGQVFHWRILRPWLFPDWIYRLSSLSRIESESLKILHGFSNKIIKMKRMRMAETRVSDVADDVVGIKRRVALLDLLLENSMEDTSNGGQLLTDEDIREEVDTFMFEGHDTTSAAISWALYCIGQYPDIQQKIVEELDEVFGDRDGHCSSEDLHNLKYLECVIKESMRIFTPVPLFGRNLKEEIDICGYRIPAGVTVFVVPFMIHRDPVHFPDPHSFNPDRFLPENSQNRDPFSYIPFSAGLRNCIGQRFAMMEEKVLLSQILRKFHLRTVVEADVFSNMADELVLRPIRGITVHLNPRNKTQ